jgi:antitoxin MazE
MSVKLKVVQIGNSQGIRLPKPLLEQCGIKKEVEAEAVEGVIVLRPIKKKHRKGWDEAFKEMSRQGDDQLLMGEGGSDFDESDWQWK